jgi:hypothetical protein
LSASHRRIASRHCSAVPFYNFVKVHKTLRTTPAMAAGLTDRVWDMAEIVALVEGAEMLVPAAHAN